MRFNLPKNDSKYHWTQHCIRKMLFYGLTADRVKRIIRDPKRVESGVAENTIAVMVPGTNKKKPSEMWVMYATALPSQLKTKSYKLKTNNFPSRKIIISAWRYPGVSPVGKQIPIPQDLLEELREEGIIK